MSIPDANQDELILKQHEAIKKDISDRTSLVTDKVDLSELEAELSADDLFRAKVVRLAELYSQFRRTRPDGNCFFRAFGFRLFEKLLNDEDRLSKVRAAIVPSLQQMVKLGMPEFTVEDFYDQFLVQLDALKTSKLSDLNETFNNDGSSNYIVVFLRLLTSKQLQLEGEFYQNFMEDGKSVAEFCNTDVEPMFIESDHIHITGLTAATGVGVRVVYLDRGAGDTATHHDFPEGQQPDLHLLYRPGHYDILYPKEMEAAAAEPEDSKEVNLGEEEVITAGRTVVLQKHNYMRTHLLNPNKNLQLGKDLINISAIVGSKFGTTFKMVSDHSKNKCFKLEVAEEVHNFESLFLNGESGVDNRDIPLDNEASQRLSKEEILQMQDDGMEGQKIVEKLIQNSETFQTKTKFSQAKFLKKKAKKYHHYILVRRPSIRLLMEIHYKADPMKVMNLRVDTLAQILTGVNVHSGGRYIVYETGAQGLVVAAVLERTGASGKVAHIYQTGQPQTNCLSAMDFHPTVLTNLSVINIQHLRSLQHGEDILANQQSRGQDGEPPRKKQNLNGAGDCMEAGKPVRQSLREQSVATHQELVGGGWDGLVIVCKQHPAALLTYLASFIAPSRPFVVFSPYKEPLLEAYMAVKEAGIAVNVLLCESWLRAQQVLPDRTHPEVMMSGGGGYLLTGIFVHR